MARITYVKKAQQRYRTVPVIDPDTGQQKRTAVLGQGGQQKRDKRGNLVFRGVTENDTSQPLPPEKCDKCGVEIKPGDPYKWIAPKSGPYGGRRMVRCAACPNWQRWEYSNSLSAQLERISFEAQEAFDQGVTTAEDVREILGQAAEEIRALGEEKREAAQNIEDGFGHPTSQSEELTEQAEQLESWAYDVENADVEDEPTEDEYPDHEFEQNEDDDTDETCAVDGCAKDESEHEETLEDALDTWRDNARDAVSALDESPL